MDHTSKWDISNDCDLFIPFVLDLLRGNTSAYLTLQIVMEDSYTARIKNATPSFLEDLAFNPSRLDGFMEKHRNELVFWRDIPQNNVFDHLLLALSSAVIMPIECNGKHRLMIFGWSGPQEFSESFRDFVTLAQSRINDILNQGYSHNTLQRTGDRFAAILEVIPQAVIFIDGNGMPGWVNHKAARLLGLHHTGEYAPSELSDAMGALRSRLVNRDEVNERAAEIFNNPELVPENWIWNVGGPESAKYRVCLLPLEVRGVQGNVWLFEEMK